MASEENPNHRAIRYLTWKNAIDKLKTYNESWLKVKLKKTGFKATVEDGFVHRVPKAYPVYTLGYHNNSYKSLPFKHILYDFFSFFYAQL